MRTPAGLIFITVLTVAIGPCAEAAAVEPTGTDCTHNDLTTRVRSLGDPTVKTLLHDGFERSATFRRLVETIDCTNGLIYVEPGKCKPGFYACLLMSVTVSGPHRLLHVRVDTSRDSNSVIASIGHELQHAIEALSEEGVTTNGQLEMFFERLTGGPTARGQLEFETDAALKAGYDVEKELQRPPRGHRK
jgi:hypothetical protein